MKRIALLLIVLCGFGFAAQAQDGFWDKMANVRFVSKLDTVSGYHYYYPVFDNYLKMKEGQIVEIEGFYLPYDFGPGSYILSKFPLASCFFCGANGPESVIQVNFDNPQDFHTDEVVRVQGVLELNADDTERLNFILNKAQLIDTMY